MPISLFIELSTKTAMETLILIQHRLRLIGRRSAPQMDLARSIVRFGATIESILTSVWGFPFLAFTNKRIPTTVRRRLSSRGIRIFWQWLISIPLRVGRIMRRAHIDAGIPVTSRPFYRPFFAFGETVTTWTGAEHAGFPLRLGIFVGLVDMKQQIVVGGNPRSERVLKPILWRRGFH